MARLVERSRGEGGRARRVHARRALCAHDRDDVRARARGARQREGDAEPSAAGTDRTGVFGRHRVSQAAAARAARLVWRADADRQTARLPRALLEPLAYHAGAAETSRNSRRTTKSAGGGAGATTARPLQDRATAA